MQLFAAYAVVAATFIAINALSCAGFDGLLYIYPRHWKHSDSNYIAGLAFLSLALFISFISVIGLSYLYKYELNTSTIFKNRKLNIVYILGFSFIAVLIIANFALDRFQNSADEFVYTFQALTFLEGRTHSPLPPIPDSFSNHWMIEKGNRWVGQYPPGWPAILAGAIVAKFPLWLVNPLFGVLTAWLLYLLVRYTQNQTVAVAAMIVFVTTPFFIFNSGSYFSHTAFASMAMIYAIGVVRYRDSGRFYFLVLAGVGLGAAFSIRYYPAVLLFLPALMIPGSIKQRIQSLFWIGIGAGPLVLAVLWYHYSAFGDPFTTGYSWNPEEGRTILGFDAWAALYLTAKKLLDMSGWAGPLVLLLYSFAFIYKARRREITFVDLLFPMVLVGLLFFPHSSGNRYGPRYYFDVYPFFVFTTVTGLASFIRHNDGFGSRVAKNALIVSVLYCLSMTPFAAHYFNDMITGRQELYKIVQDKKLNNAVVVVDSWAGDGRRMYERELVRNNPNLSADVLYARNVSPELLQRHFPGREIWVYRRDDNSSPAYLTKALSSKAP